MNFAVLSIAVLDKLEFAFCNLYRLKATSCWFRARILGKNEMVAKALDIL